MKWPIKKILVTGGSGFLGSVMVEKLRSRGARQVLAPRSQQLDLREKSQLVTYFERERPQIVLHLAARVGGIGINQKNPGSFFYDNAVMGIQLMEVARQYGVEKFVSVGTICAYPKFTPVPFREADLWNGYPEETNAPYGLAKKMLLVQSQAYRAQYGFNAIHLLPVNLFGPGDNFDPESSHVIPALIKKCIEARDAERDSIELWGDGTPTREFLYVDDAAEGVLLATERYDGAEPINLGSGEEITIADLAAAIAQATGFRGKLKWDTSKPNGQPRRCLDVSRARQLFGFQATHTLKSGLEKTIAWYLEQRAAHAPREAVTGRRVRLRA
jgi:GDP-L-fucose synthase